MTSRLLGVLVLVGTLAGCAIRSSDETPEPVAEVESAELHWTHEDPEAWGETCATGTEQSPVDLTQATPEDLVDIDFDYQPSEVLVSNTGHTVQAGYGTGSAIGVEGTWYDLIQFHFHAPSEHTIDGENAAAELHLVHQDEDGNLAVVGVLVEKGEANEAVAQVLTDVPDQPGAERRPETDVDADGLLPDTHLTYRYDGSLTTPPCSEGVKWMVMTEPVTWSAKQLAAFTDLYDGSNRPVQPLNERVELVDSSE